MVRRKITEAKISEKKTLRPKWSQKNYLKSKKKNY